MGWELTVSVCDHGPEEPGCGPPAYLAVRAARIRRGWQRAERLARPQARRADVAAKLAETQECEADDGVVPARPIAVLAR